MMGLETYSLKTLPQSNQGTNSGCGFILMNNNEQMEILYLVRPYSNSNLFKLDVRMPSSLKMFNKRDMIHNYRRFNYAERLTIPRGKGEKKENLLTTALREFMEETSIRLEHIRVFNYFFNLTFEDDKTYCYTIFMGYSQIPYDRLTSNNYLKVKYSDKENLFQVGRTLKTVTMENYRIANAKIQYRDYIRFMQEYQLKCYKHSNYHDLFNYLSFMIYKKKTQSVQISHDPEEPIYCWNDVIADNGSYHAMRPIILLDIRLEYQPEV